MNEVIIRIGYDNESVIIEENTDGIIKCKSITPDSLAELISSSYVATLSTGVLPPKCLSYSQKQDGTKYVCIDFDDRRANMSYFGTDYDNLPIPRMVFGFTISNNKVNHCSVAVVSDDKILRPDSVIYHYPFANVSGFSLCTGNNSLPKINSLHQLSGLPYYILGMPEGTHSFHRGNNKPELDLRELLEHLRDKTPEYYYTDVLKPSTSTTLQDFILEKNSLY